MKHVPLVVGTRDTPQSSSYVETLHYGSIVVTNGHGEVRGSVGDVSTTTPARSTAKAFQLLPLLLSGEQNLALTDLALMMSSHSGEQKHIDGLNNLLKINNLKPSMLQCGTHTPISELTRNQLIQQGHQPNVLHCNCSGKHIGMLITCQRRSWDLPTYMELDHPLQKQIRMIIETMANCHTTLPHVIDGCGLPTFVISLKQLCKLFSCFCLPNNKNYLDGIDVSPQLSLLRKAATQHADFIAGDGRLDTELMWACQGRVFAKTGADGVYAMATTPTSDFSTGLSIAIKVSHSDTDSRIRRLIATEVLKQCGVRFNNSVIPTHSIIKNNRGNCVGEYNPCFSIF